MTDELNPREPRPEAPLLRRPTAAVGAIVEHLRAELDRLPAAEKAIVAGGLHVLDRCARVVESMETLVEEQRGGVRRGREILELLPPLIGKLGELLDLELQDARARLEDRLRGRR